MRRFSIAAIFAAALLLSPDKFVVAQICNSMTGSLNCASPEGFLPGVGEGGSGGSARRSGSLPGVSTLGGDIVGGDTPGTFGAVTFGSGGRKCSGMFRSVNC